MKQKLISASLAIADAVHRHPKRITAAIASIMLSGAGGAFAVASLAPAMPFETLRLVTETITTNALSAQSELLDGFRFTLYRSDRTRASDSAESLLTRLGVADVEAAAFLRENEATRQALFGRSASGRLVTVEANDRQGLQQLSTHWLDSDSDTHFKRLVVERSDDGFGVRIDAEPLVTALAAASGEIRTSLFAATDAAGVPDSVARQLTDIFEGSIDFRRDLRRGDRFAIVFETIQADGETVSSGRIISAQMSSKGKVHEALWFVEGEGQGDYYAFDGQSLRKAFLIEPLPFTRVTSNFGMRKHPVSGARKGHAGIDYAAPTGTPVRTVADGTVSFAGVQRGYGKVIYVKHDEKDTTVYGHLSRIDVKTGDKVGQGTKIGEVGATGVATGPHLHFEFRINDEPHDPSEIMAQHRQNKPVLDQQREAFAALSNDMQERLALAHDMAEQAQLE